MNPYVISVQKEQTVEEAIRSISQYIELQNSMQPFYTVYVVDEFQHLTGTVAVTQLLLAKRQTLISEMMNPNVIAVDVDLDQEDVVHIAKEYDLVVVPVIDKYLRLIGRITIDDLVDVIYEEHQEDIAQISGTAKEDVLEVSLIKTVRERLPWLMLGMLGGGLTALVMRSFEYSLIDIPQVTYFIPLIAAMAGNIGIQSSSIVVRGLATGAIGTSDLIFRVWRELRVGVLLGIICSIVIGLMTFLLTWNLGMAITTPIALFIVLCFAAVGGSAIPILLKRANIDPALAIGPFITTMNDLIGVWIYLTIAFQVRDWP
jgi:magnesium transporter